MRDCESNIGSPENQDSFRHLCANDQYSLEKRGSDLVLSFETLKK